jgi:hypothetical protein
MHHNSLKFSDGKGGYGLGPLPVSYNICDDEKYFFGWDVSKGLGGGGCEKKANF